MEANEIVKALRWLSNETEFIFAVEQLQQAADLIEHLQKELEVAIKHLRLLDWCNGCKHFAGLGGCRIGKMTECTGKNDLYEFEAEGNNGA